MHNWLKLFCNSCLKSDFLALILALQHANYITLHTEFNVPVPNWEDTITYHMSFVKIK